MFRKSREEIKRKKEAGGGGYPERKEQRVSLKKRKEKNVEEIKR